jgi:hypothetical protein
MDALVTGHRRHEHLVRARTQLDEPGAEFFLQAFLGPTAKLCWPDVEERAQQAARAFSQLCTRSFAIPAHRELNGDSAALLSEFLLLSQLFWLEVAATALKFAASILFEMVGSTGIAPVAPVA